MCLRNVGSPVCVEVRTTLQPGRSTTSTLFYYPEAGSVSVDTKSLASHIEILEVILRLFVSCPGNWL